MCPCQTQGAALAFSTADTLWSVEEPGLLRRWNALTGQQRGVHFLSDVETAWEFSPDARWLASASDDLSLWEVATGRLHKTWRQASWVTAIPFAREAEATDHELGPTSAGRHRTAQLVHQTIPYLALDDRDLAAAALVRVADQAAPRDQLRLADGIHRAAVGALDPDGLEPSAHRVCSTTRRE